MKFQSIRRLALTAWILSAVFALGSARAEQDVDVDLSACSRGITYAQMMQVCRSPEDYDGKLFRLKGKFNYSEEHDLARIIFSDNTGCCETVLVFEAADELAFPEDYPPLWGNIMITARLTANENDPDMPCCFTDAVVEREK
ncbi:MAG: hypothetical protein K5746_05015 [Clostridiales bacterium]|nr:hypothetical protein [Clostridiales bacterium]